MARQREVPQEKIREAIQSIPDVGSCDIEIASDGTISAIHVVSRSAKPPKQIVRDIETILAAEFGLKVDHRKVSVAKLETRLGREGLIGARPRLVSLNISIVGARARCEVVLERDEVEFRGEAQGIASQTGRLRLIGEATLKALSAVVEGYADFSLTDVLRIRSGDRSAVVVLVSCIVEGTPKELAGCVRYSEDEHTAVALAALDACNRVIEASPRSEHTEYEVSPYEDV